MVLLALYTTDQLNNIPQAPQASVETIVQLTNLSVIFKT